jgi:hypothetical protein
MWLCQSYTDPSLGRVRRGQGSRRCRSTVASLSDTTTPCPHSDARSDDGMPILDPSTLSSVWARFIANYGLVFQIRRRHLCATASIKRRAKQSCVYRLDLKTSLESRGGCNPAAMDGLYYPRSRSRSVNVSSLRATCRYLSY